MNDDYIAVSMELAAAARPCFNDVDRDFVDAQLAAGEYFFAVDDALRVAVREHYRLPAALVAKARGWLDTPGGVPAAHRARFAHHLDAVLTAPTQRSA